MEIMAWFYSKLHELVVPIGLAINVLSSIFIVQINKYIYVEYTFPNMTLTCIHFVITFIGLVLCHRSQVFQHVEIPIGKMLPMAVTFCGFVVLTNISLQYNAIGTYQCLKTLTIPVVMGISFLYYKQSYSSRVQLSIVTKKKHPSFDQFLSDFYISQKIPILLGIFFNSMYDLNFNVFGLTIGLVGTAVTSLYQVWVGEKQKEFKVNALQLLIYQAPLSSLMLMCVIPFFEPVVGEGSIFDPDRTKFEFVNLFFFQVFWLT
jgi:solute carrier family 35 protein E3